MALFTINRYLGDEQDSFSNEVSEDVVAHRLDKLLSYARAKKRRTQVEDTDDIDQDDTLLQLSNDQQSVCKDCSDEFLMKSNKNKRKKIKLKQGAESNLVSNSQDLLFLEDDGQLRMSNDSLVATDLDDSHDLIDSPCDVTVNSCDSSDIPGDDTKLEDGIQYFPILGSKSKHSEKRVVLRKLPVWMENPTLVEIDIKENSLPVVDLAVSLPTVIQRNLKRMKIVKFFPVQYHVIPDILMTAQGLLLGGPSGRRPQDICVNAPTGSGKTLAYALPIVAAIMNRVVCQVRALVVVPSRDLAIQVKAVLNDVAKGTGLKITAITGQSSMEKEQAELVNKTSIPVSSGADIVVATPGRLVDHMNLTKHFCLMHLRFLIIDEVDRLLDQSFQEWIAKLFDFINIDQQCPKSLSLYSCLTSVDSFLCTIPDPRLDIFIPIPHSPIPFHSTAQATPTQSNIQKLLFSATIPQNPEKLALLKLYCPKLFTTAVVPSSSTDEVLNYTGRFALPSTLKEYCIVCPAKHKPLAVIHLIENEKISRMLCFTSSKDSTHRLCLLLKLYGIPGVAEYSASLPQKKRKSVLSDFSSGKINMLVCSDAMSRGMDVDMVSCVINYDAPVYMKTYLHRVGRTARAGEHGIAYTILRPQEVFHFNKMFKQAGRGRPTKQRMANTMNMIPQYQTALNKLKQELATE